MASDPASAGAAAAGPATLAETELAARPRAALKVMFELFSRSLENGLEPLLDEFEQQLFRLAEQARSGDLQKRCFESLREFRRGRGDLVRRAVARLDQALASVLGEPSAPAFVEQAMVAGGDATATVLTELARKAELRATQSLYPLGQRFGVLAGTPAFEVEALPVGPYWLLECLRVGCEVLGLHPDHLEHFLRLIERTWWAELPQLYDDANAHLIEARVLPNLPGARSPKVRPLAHHRASELAIPTPAAASIDPVTTATPAAAPAPAPAAAPAAEAARPIQYEWAKKPAPVPARPAPLLRAGVVDLSGFELPLLGWPTPGQIAAGLTAENDTQDLDLYDRMRELLADKHHRESVRQGEESSSSHVARSEDVQAVLGLLQKRPIAPMVIGGRLVPRSIAHVKQDLMNKLREFTPDGHPPRLPEVDGDTLEMVAMLFDELGRRTRPESPGQALLGRLQVPVLRVALADKRFFTRRLFPARQFLNAVVEVAMEWASDDPEDRAIAEKIALLVDRAVNDFRGNVELFGELHADFLKHQQTVTRKAEVAERRHVEAARGREKLEQSRRMAAAAIAERVGKGRAAGLIRALLEQAWTDVLALTLLRHGEHSPAYLTKLAVADRLIETLGTQESRHQEPDATATEFLRQELETGLAQVGSHSEDIQRLLDRLFGGAAGAEMATPTELAVMLKTRTRLGAESVASLAQQFAAPRETGALSEFEQGVLARLRAMPQGAWLDLGSGPQGEVVRRKLAWTSATSDRCLIVSQRGGRVDEPPLGWLAREIARGNARVVPAEPDQPVDKALRVVLAQLRQSSDTVH